MSEPQVISTRHLDESQWRDAQQRHHDRVRPWVAPRQARRRRAESHPVDDFLFDYYPYSIAKLTAWHPGYGVVLRGVADEFLAHPAYVRTSDGITVDLSTLNHQRHAMVERLLTRTSRRSPQLGCFGLHEWAMVHGVAEVRHESFSLRVSPSEVERVVEELGLRCTHIDAYRFFTPTATPLNMHEPTRSEQDQWEQPGCLHANMDLYKYAMWFSPFIASQLVADCFELARTARDLDMRAAPYDLSALGYEPVRIETAEGRREYVDGQRAVAVAAESLRTRLLSCLRELHPGG